MRCGGSRALEVREHGEHAGVHAGFVIEGGDDFVQHRLVDADERAPARRSGSATTRGRGSSSTSSNSPVMRRSSAAAIVSRRSSGGRMQSAHETSSSTRLRCTRAVFGFASRNSRSAPSARRKPASSSTAAATRVVIDRHRDAHHGLALHRALTEARQRDRVQAAEPAAHDRHDLIGPLDEVHPATTVDTVPVARAARRSPRARGRSGCQACSWRYAVRSSTSGNAAPNRSAHIGLNATTTSPLPTLPRNMFASGIGDALGDQVEEIARVVVVDVGHREGSLATVHRDDVVVGGEAAALGERRPRRPLLPLADAEAEAGRLPEHRLRRLARALAADVAQAERDRAPDRHRTTPAGAAHATRRGSRYRARRGTVRSR